MPKHIKIFHFSGTNLVTLVYTLLYVWGVEESQL